MRKRILELKEYNVNKLSRLYWMQDNLGQLTIKQIAWIRSKITRCLTTIDLCNFYLHPKKECEA